MMCLVILGAAFLLDPCFWDLAVAVPPGPIWWSCDMAPAVGEPYDVGVQGGRQEVLNRAREAVDPTVVAALYRGAGYGGLVRLRNVVSPDLAGRMRREAEDWRDRGILRCSEGHPGRKDLHAYLTEEEASQRGAGAIGQGLALLAAICGELSRQRPEGEPALGSTPAQLACYPGDGEFFWAHHDGVAAESLPAGMPDRDRRLIALRRVTAILYMQARWEREWGGALRAHCDRAFGRVPPIDLLPEAGSLVLFRSRDLWHEVLPTYRPRYALTMWYFERAAT